MPAASSAALIRARSTRATRHCSCGWVRTTTRITTRSGRERLDAEHARLVEQQLAELGRRRLRRVRRSRITSVAVLEVGVVGDCDVDERARPLLRLVPDPHDRAVRDVPHHAVEVTQPRRAQAHALDRAGGDADVDHVADAVLVLEQHEEPGEEVADQRLRAEPERDAGDPGTREQRREVHSELARAP